MEKKSLKTISLQKSVIWCWLQELICSCADVIPLSATDADHDNDGTVTLEDSNDINDPMIKNFKQYRNNNNCNYAMTDTKNNEEQNQPLQIKSLPNPSAVFKTVAALITMDYNPHHQNIKNFQQQHEFQMRLQEYQNHQYYQQMPQRFMNDKKHFLINNKPDLRKQRRYMLLENNGTFPEEEEEDDNESGDQDRDREKQNNLTATCTKEQMMMEFENSNYYHYDNNFNSGGGGKNDYYDNGQINNCCNRNFHNNARSSNKERKLPGIKYFGSPTTTSVGNLYRHCKLKTFQKIKLNLITHHGNNGGAGSNHCSSSSSSSFLSSSMDAKTLQTILETDNDVITGSTSSPSSNSGLYQLIDEKYSIKETELSDKVNCHSSNNSSATSVANASNDKYKLFDLSSSVKKACEKSQSTFAISQHTEKIVTAATTGNTVSKRIEFFEHANIPNGGIFKPKSNIYSIYRVHDLVENEKLVKNAVKINEAGSPKAATFLLRHDSNTLTIILSCFFIVTFLLLISFPLPG